MHTQDSTEINLSGHRNRIHKNNDIGTTNSNNTQGLGFFFIQALLLTHTVEYPMVLPQLKYGTGH